MDNTEAIKELKEIIEDRKSYLVGDYDKTFDKHIQALEYAIRELENNEAEKFLNYLNKEKNELKKIINEIESKDEEMTLREQSAKYKAETSLEIISSIKCSVDNLKEYKELVRKKYQRNLDISAT